MCLSAILMRAKAIECKALLFLLRNRCLLRVVRWNFSIKTASGSNELYVDLPRITEAFAP
jgi:hypothetical protein